MQVTEAKIPAVFIYKSDGEALAAAEDKIITLSKEQHKVIDYEMSEFSSWGATSALTLKPEITAPGGNIYSSLSIDENGGSVYGYNSGTSMASPNAAGGLTLIRQRINELYPDLSAKERLALTYKTAMSTAEIRKDAMVGFILRENRARDFLTSQAQSKPRLIFRSKGRTEQKSNWATTPKESEFIRLIST